MDQGEDRQAASANDGRDETPLERLDRNWDELLQELRVVQTGVQILAGFLLTLPFQQRFTEIEDLNRVVYLVAFGLAVVATAFLVAPVSAHRLLFRKGEKAALVALANRCARVGLVALALAVSAVAFVIFDVVTDTGIAVVAAGGCVGALRRQLAGATPRHPAPRQGLTKVELGQSSLSAASGTPPLAASSTAPPDPSSLCEPGPPSGCCSSSPMAGAAFSWAEPSWSSWRVAFSDMAGSSARRGRFSRRLPGTEPGETST